jgi:hypothetical protein
MEEGINYPAYVFQVILFYQVQGNHFYKSVHQTK